ncbi:PspC domain-containing protein [Amycolatopsis saalfeldensis]|uniref:Phage shock protein PspC (Stress-responsive transcriptional regulator) n=1 Tax=Amycolatopsis saalfeldensis TaxID=394193 RepID=A0A1H8YFX2_9PSEU|nr:PspC domain-containing protein [Amycolatopsis saalfeldensis]SEP51120.1 Phage shock protein PspC (stress-responsive transcriptional regulator) [Amycolatopsis saalfeldensis]
MTPAENPVPAGSGRPKLTRSRKHYVFGGVCGGLAEFYGWTPYRVRLLFVISCIIPGPQFLLYLVMWFVIPNAPKPR